MYVSLLALSHSVWGWLQYVNNPEIMGKFSLSELNEVNSTLNKFTLEFLEYDIKITKMGMEKGLREMVREGGRSETLIWRISNLVDNNPSIRGFVNRFKVGLVRQVLHKLVESRFIVFISILVIVYVFCLV